MNVVEIEVDVVLCVVEWNGPSQILLMRTRQVRGLAFAVAIWVNMDAYGRLKSTKRNVHSLLRILSGTNV